MIDVFLRLAPKDPIRVHLAAAVYARWRQEEDIRLRTMWMENTVPTFGELGDLAVNALPKFPEVCLPEKDFAWTSRQYADQHAGTDPYILADDDHLILGKNFTGRFIDEWEKYPGYVLFSSASAVSGERPYEGALWQEGIVEPACAGATMLHRKGMIPYHQFKGMKASQQDVVVCDWLRSHGHKFALSKSVHYLHLGFGLSQVEPLLWGRY